MSDFNKETCDLIERLGAEIDHLMIEHEHLSSLCDALNQRHIEVSSELEKDFNVLGCMALFSLHDRITFYSQLHLGLLDQVKARAEFIEKLLPATPEPTTPVTVTDAGSGVH